MEFFGAANAVIAILAQGIRSRPGLTLQARESLAATVIVVASVAAYWLGTEGADPTSKQFWQEAVIYVAVSAGLVQGASSLANVAGVKALQTRNGADHGSGAKGGEK